MPFTEELAWHALSRVLDPEVPVLSVLELGIVQEAGDDYVWVKRSTGNRCAYATPMVLRRELADFDVREMGPSVNQSGDPVPRFVLHIRARTIAAADAARGDDGVESSNRR